MILDLFNLDGKAAFVTGADKGLGQGLVFALAEAGADIIGLSRSDSGETAKAVQALGRKYHAINGDLQATNAEDLHKMIDEAAKQFGRLDILVNNAGTIRRGPALDFSETDWDDVMQVNLKSAFFLSQAAARMMAKNGGGKIINIASLISVIGGMNVPAYAAAKGGVVQLTKALSNQWAGRGVNVNAVVPGFIHTDLTEDLVNDPGEGASLLARIPVSRWGVPDDLKGIAVFLASNASNYVSGTVIPVDGGFLVR